MNLPPERRPTHFPSGGSTPFLAEPPSGLAATLKGLPNWAVGLFGGLGVLAVGLGIFTVVLSREGSSGAGAPVRPASGSSTAGAPQGSVAAAPSAAPAASDHQGTRDPRVPAAVVEHLTPIGREVAAAEGAAIPAPPPVAKRGLLRAKRLRLAGSARGSSAGDGTAGEIADDAEDTSPEAPVAAPADTEKKVAAAAPPAAAEPAADEREGATLADAEKLQADMEALLVALGPRIEACARAADATGAVEVRVSVGADGTVKAARLLGDLAATPAASCIQDLVKGTTYPRFTGASMKLSHRFAVE